MRKGDKTLANTGAKTISHTAQVTRQATPTSPYKFIAFSSMYSDGRGGQTIYGLWATTLPQRRNYIIPTLYDVGCQQMLRTVAVNLKVRGYVPCGSVRLRWVMPNLAPDESTQQMMLACSSYDQAPSSAELMMTEMSRIDVLDYHLSGQCPSRSCTAVRKDSIVSTRRHRYRDNGLCVFAFLLARVEWCGVITVLRASLSIYNRAIFNILQRQERPPETDDSQATARAAWDAGNQDLFSILLS